MSRVLVRGRLKLCDFGSCVLGCESVASAADRARAEEAISKTTTQCYRAPELCDLYRWAWIEMVK